MYRRAAPWVGWGSCSYSRLKLEQRGWKKKSGVPWLRKRVHDGTWVKDGSGKGLIQMVGSVDIIVDM